MLKVLFVTLCLIPVTAGAFSMEIDIAPLPPLHFDSPPEVSVVPNLVEYVYVVPDVSGVYFYAGYWYRHHRGHWFRSAFYDGPWIFIHLAAVPVVLIDLPPLHTYYRPAVQYRIQYFDLSRNWRYWARSHHWHGHEWYRHEWVRPDNRLRYEVPPRNERPQRPAPVDRRYDRPFEPHNRAVIMPAPRPDFPQHNSRYSERGPSPNEQRPNRHDQERGHQRGKHY